MEEPVVVSTTVADSVPRPIKGYAGDNDEITTGGRDKVPSLISRFPQIASADLEDVERSQGRMTQAVCVPINDGNENLLPVSPGLADYWLCVHLLSDAQVAVNSLRLPKEIESDQPTNDRLAPPSMFCC